MSRKIIILVIVFVLALAVTLPAFACPPEPPENDWNCSPGFWKNHEETWGNTDAWSSYPGNNGWSLMEALTQKGWGDKDAKWAAWEFLNTSPYSDGSNCK